MMMVTLPVFVDEGVEGHAVSPAGGEVVDVHVGIPEEKTGEQTTTVKTTRRRIKRKMFSAAGGVCGSGGRGGRSAIRRLVV